MRCNLPGLHFKSCHRLDHLVYCFSHTRSWRSSFDVSRRFQSTSTASTSQRGPQKPLREYFYWIDIHGYLYLEETAPKNFTSSYKDKRFLDFFYSRVQSNTTGDHKEYPYISPCGPEMNYIKSKDVPIVFTDLVPATLTNTTSTTHTHNNSSSTTTFDLIYAGTLRHPFNPSYVHVCTKTGRLYHALPSEVAQRFSQSLDGSTTSDAQGKETTTTANGGDRRHLHGFGLLRTSLVQGFLADRLEHVLETATGGSSSSSSMSGGDELSGMRDDNSFGGGGGDGSGGTSDRGVIEHDGGDSFKTVLRWIDGKEYLVRRVNELHANW